jgi:hypothetical protein
MTRQPRRARWIFFQLGALCVIPVMGLDADAMTRAAAETRDTHRTWTAMAPPQSMADAHGLPEHAGAIGPLHRGSNGEIEAVDPTTQRGGEAGACPQGTICTGPTQIYTGLCAALKVARNGDTIMLLAGVYHEACAITASRITIKAERGAHITGVAYGGKGNLVVVGDDTIIDGLECSKAYAEGNGSCIRIEGRNVTLRHMHIHDEQMGILSGGANGRILIEDSLIENIGLPNSDLSHCIYISQNKSGVADELIVRRSTIRHSLFSGHLIKSRATKTIVEDSVIASFDGDDSREFDIPQGGTAIIRRNVIEKGPGSENEDVFGLALEPQFGLRTNNDTLIEDNWIIVDRPHGTLMTNRSPGPVRLLRNRIVGLADRSDVTRSTDASSTGNRVEALDNRFFATRKQAGLDPYPMLPSSRM